MIVYNLAGWIMLIILLAIFAPFLLTFLFKLAMIVLPFVLLIFVVFAVLWVLDRTGIIDIYQIMRRIFGNRR